MSEHEAPETREQSGELAPRHGLGRVPSRAIAVAAIVALTVGGTLFFVGNREEATRADTNGAIATDQATTLDQLCATDPDVARRIPDDCAEAREIREEVVLPATAPGPSQAQVQGWVEEWLEKHPPRDGEDVTPGMVARAVAEHMEGNGQEQIAAVARAYLASNPEAFRGEDGEDGADGQNATDDQVATAVAAFCAERNGCAGPQGERGGDGPQGQGVIDAQPIRNGEGQCEWVVTFEDPRDGSRTERRHPAGDAACPAVPPPAPPQETGGGLLPGG
jgi:hypothetical protein